MVCFPSPVEDLFAYKDCKQSLFAKLYKIVDENKIIMSGDARFLTLLFVHAPPLARLIKSIKPYYLMDEFFI